MLQSQVIRLVEQRLRHACLPVNLEFWNGLALTLSDKPSVTVNVRSPKGLLSLFMPTLGKFAQNYVEQDIDLIGGAREIIRLGEILCQASERVSAKNRFSAPWARRTRPSDRHAIAYHYDVSNEFYGLWLDRRWIYSCAYFRDADDSLDQAQEQKLEHICRKLDLRENQHFLDIGCGWGALMLWAAEHYGVFAEGITLSRSQYQHVMGEIAARGLEKRCRVRLMDYRDLPEAERFDKIASVGMFEHVGLKNFPVYFGKIYRLLKPGGLVLNHGITSVRMDGAGLGSGIGEFIQRYVFPGGELAHVSAVVEAMSHQNLECWDIECLRPHYAKTLWHWVERLEARQDEARRMVGEDRFRIWRIYMAGSAHAFERGWLSIFQLLAARPYENGEAAYPLTRECIYR